MILIRISLLAILTYYKLYDETGFWTCLIIWMYFFNTEMQNIINNSNLIVLQKLSFIADELFNTKFKK